ncbi:coiled-coil domain-containing protein 63 [Rhinatrema bivittatum]|uniref:coiled-coil domain-containing protein 63 n=1 Tax=Rhinatrema bivittatum TaxID=194408 RepID=UPI00112A01D3|nr:coiled-coil domain-containing protein 63 [Rhinatrema bivittatum]XP_029427952.1 coiled-coil domain-containing protein 63 [Rhinatrema bivittatum]XP_029427953.1 coiled-coil domain-containing protein 63 [Rhinatrema bivittatum]
MSRSAKVESLIDVKEKEPGEFDLKRVHAQFKILEESRKSFTKRTQNAIRFQQEELSLLQHEHDEIMLSINVLKSPKNVTLDSNNVIDLKVLLQTKDECDSLIRQERALIFKLDNEIKEMDDKISQEKNILSKIKSLQQNKKFQKWIQTLENRLNHATTNFDKTMTKNAKLREEINNLRFERGIFNSFYQKFIKELNQQKVSMNKVINQSLEAQDERAEIQARIFAMKERRAKELLHYNVEIRELIRIFEHENKQRIFMQAKSFDRSEIEREEVTKKNEAFAKIRAKKPKEETIESYQAAYERLIRLSGHEDVESLIDQFNENEEKNFASFNFVNEINSEIERLQVEIHNIEDEIANLKSQQHIHSGERYQNLKQLEEKLRKTIEEADLSEQSYKEVSKIMDHLSSGIHTIFTTIQCDASRIKLLLGTSEGITDHNLMHYFSAIEQKTSDLLQIETFLRLKSLKGQDPIPIISINPFLGGSEVATVVPSIKITSPILAEETEAERDQMEDSSRGEKRGPQWSSASRPQSRRDSDSYPMDFDELRNKVLQDIHNKEMVSKSMNEEMPRSSRDKKRAVTA